MYACMHARTHACMYVCMYVYVYVRVFDTLYVYICISYVHIYILVYKVEGNGLLTFADGTEKQGPFMPCSAKWYASTHVFDLSLSIHAVCFCVCVCVCACVRVCGVAIVCHANLHGLQVQSCLASLCGTCVDACVHVAGGRYACTRCRCPLIERSVGTSSIFLVSECAGLENADFRASDSGSAVNNIVLPYYSLPTPNHWPENLRS